MSSENPPSDILISNWKMPETINSVVPENPQELNFLEKYIRKNPSPFWISILEIRNPVRAKAMNKIVYDWENVKEKFAFILPKYVGFATVEASATIVQRKIFSDLIKNNVKASFFKTYANSKIFYGSSIIMNYYLYSMLYESFVKTQLRNDKPFYVFPILAVIMINGGVLFPATLPTLASRIHNLRNRNTKVFKNQEFNELLNEALKLNRMKFAKLALFQISIASLCTFSLFWAHKRIFNAAEVQKENSS